MSQLSESRDITDVEDSEERVRSGSIKAENTFYDVPIFQLVLVMPYHVCIEIEAHLEFPQGSNQER